MFVPVVIALFAFRPVTSHTVSGKITGISGNPVAGARIIVKGEKQVTVSAADGSFRIAAADKTGTLVITAAGFKSKEEKINGRTTILVVLDAVSTSLQKPMLKRMQKNDLAFSKSAKGYTPGIMAQEQESYAIGREMPYGDTRYKEFNTEGYDHISENRFLKVADNPLSTFSIDVDAASYSNVRRFLNLGQLPPAGAVRIEEMINYFRYDYPQPAKDQPFSINTEISDAPWNREHRLVLIGLQGKKIPIQDLPASNLVFLIDVSGSMEAPNKLSLVKSSMKMLVDQLREQDRVAIVVYAGAAGLVLQPTSGENKTKIKEAIDNLGAGGSTAGGAGIRLAYKTAKEHFIKDGNNRVILCTDGDFNIGESSDDAMERLIGEERKTGVFLTVLGYGMGNYQDSKMQKLADKGNGNHAYIDGITEAKKVLINEFGGTLFTIAKDVKLQIEFNPALVQGYRLIGYENRMLAKEDFNDDKKDAGELGSGHTVTALYEIIPVGIKDSFLAKVDPLKYQENNVVPARTSSANEILTVKFRYKTPGDEVSKLIEHAVRDQQITLDKTSDNFRFASAVAEFGMLLRSSEFRSNASFSNVIKMARNAKGKDEEGYRSEFIRLAESAGLLTKETKEGHKEELTGVTPLLRN